VEQEDVANTPSITALFDLIATLRGEHGCPWDRKQTPVSITVYLIEEAYELVEAIHAGDTDAVQEELGDVLFQILFLISLYQQEKRFGLSEVAKCTIDKMVRRHPHVFGGAKVESVGEVKQRWREIKQQEKAAAPCSVLDSVPACMPGLMRAYRIGERAAGTGFDWENLRGVIGQTEAEWDEFKSELHLGDSSAVVEKERAAMEFGDVLFTMVNVARMAGIHPETALSQSTQKFISRFQHMEAAAAARNQRLQDLGRDQMEDLWIEAKKRVP
jgi:tetrapyrrole methylase family protein/MazG family protein